MPSVKKNAVSCYCNRAQPEPPEMWVAVERDSLLMQKQPRPRREAKTIIGKKAKKKERRASIDFIIPPGCAVKDSLASRPIFSKTK